mmetsp:Transcript_9810/g.16172  ORF Transcript_9810/g.16172 Transcript_9810/m.16172 type:complete len:300 (+) Transcript_9810:133-1032(+)|eukprot:CAMPEP_0174983516 /NCGR_PEP_ID=MMETSP0004_2-20121128/17178_1 /TAXON_ID=420556 /ORGANISM="Ochromonas sp., Strain CCMP1393" /LENGTH=299 /DNA_ID=CAMNT_0016235759 /DNA_START=133 /DNA_END=1032 /DNA_ORIENTATION=-
MQRSFRVSRVATRLAQFRGMATEKQLKERMIGTTNIEKITKSMKMVSAAKLRGDQNRLAAAIPFASWTDDITGPEQQLEDLDVSGFPQKNLLVILSTDKGLCGGVNTILARMTRTVIRDLQASGKEVDLYVCGEKGRSQLNRTHGEMFVGAATDRVMPYSFELACAITEDIKEGDYDGVHLLYNRFKSAIAYVPSIKSVEVGPLVDPASPFLYDYEVEPENDPETLNNLYEYTLATKVFHSLLDNATSEQSSRMSAMENASKNAGEMIGKLELQYNRARQARITTELIEIISGASALKG